MATREIELKAENGIDVLGLVSKEPTWKELLVELVEKSRLDPWDIDIAEIVDNYMNAIKDMKSLDLKIPANIILAAAILLRLKSGLLVTGMQEPGPEQENYESTGIESIVVEPLNARSRMQPKRRVSLDELITALGEAMKIKEQRAEAAGFVRPAISFEIGRVDIKADSGKVYDYIKESVDSEKVALFSVLASNGKFGNILLELFIPMLYLASENQISLRQDRFFEEIFVSLN